MLTLRQSRQSKTRGAALNGRRRQEQSPELAKKNRSMDPSILNKQRRRQPSYASYHRARVGSSETETPYPVRTGGLT